MPSIEFEVWCSCGAGLCNQTRNRRGGIEIDPCEACLAEAGSERYEEGYRDGQKSMIEEVSD